MKAWWRIGSVFLSAAVVVSAMPALALAQTSSTPASEPADKPPLKQEELDQLVASIALYPDPVLTQLLMASTYPLEIVEADRWTKKNAGLKGDALAAELEKQPWDDSVKSLVNFPDVLSMASEQLSWTVKLGDAVIGQQEQVMATIQSLRAKAKGQGNLETNAQQVVKTETVTAEGEPPVQTIVIEPASPTTIYVPQYNPAVVYGGWAYPAYPPYFYPRAGYVAGAAISFGLGVAAGAAWGHAWGHANWGHHGSIDIDSNRNRNVNRNVNRSGGGGRQTWQHNPAHRGSAPYRNNATAQKFGGGRSANTAKARESFRGRSDAGRQNVGGGGADRSRGQAGADRSRQGGSRGSTASTARGGQSRERARSSGGGTGGAFGNANRGGSSARASSSRGNSSRASSGSRGSSRSSGSRGGGSRGGGSRGGGRGGGGRR